MNDALTQRAESAAERKATHRRFPVFLTVIAAAALLASLVLALRYSGQPILEAHGFRQTQTAHLLLVLPGRLPLGV